MGACGQPGAYLSLRVILGEPEGLCPAGAADGPRRGRVPGGVLGRGVSGREGPGFGEQRGEVVAAAEVGKGKDRAREEGG